jgi:hypothetical protein
MTFLAVFAAGTLIFKSATVIDRRYSFLTDTPRMFRR